MLRFSGQGEVQPIRGDNVSHLICEMMCFVLENIFKGSLIPRSVCVLLDTTMWLLLRPGLSA